MTPTFAPRRVSFDGCVNEQQALERLESAMDDAESHTVRSYAAGLMAAEPDITDAEFQDCLMQLRAALAEYRAETRAERLATFRQIVADARACSAHRAVRVL